MLHLTEIDSDGGDADETLTLPYEARQKSRQRVCLDSGAEAGIILPSGTRLRDGDVLRAADGTRVRVRASDETVSRAVCETPLELARACYHLGNRHVAVEIAADGVRYQPDHVLDDMLRGLRIEVVGDTAPFEPEPGAYGGHRAGGHPH